MEAVIAAAAQATPGVRIRRGAEVAGLMTGDPAPGGVPRAVPPMIGPGLQEYGTVPTLTLPADHGTGRFAADFYEATMATVEPWYRAAELAAMADS
ncbi:MAG: hypothetical protein M3Y33_04515 [Actinomycetota bacterium]|nr:hypothetical protein [Actinomycetota bacterium]